MNYEHEIQRAEKHLEEMASTKQVSDYEAAWHDFLFRIERIWERLRKQYQNQPWYSKIYGPYGKLLKKDPLLRYLKQARNAESHVFEGTISSPLTFKLRDLLGRKFGIKDLSTTFEQGVLTLSIDTDSVLFEPDVEISRGEPKLIRFKSRGNWYNPPTSHLGNSITTKNPVIIAKLGLEILKSCVSEIQAKINEL